MAKRSRLVARSLRAPKKAEALSESEGVAQSNRSAFLVLKNGEPSTGLS